MYTEKVVPVDRTPLTNEEMDVSCRKLGRVNWQWPCTAKTQARSAMIGRKNINIDRSDKSSPLLWIFFCNPIVPYGKKYGTAGRSSGTAGYIRKIYPCLLWGLISTIPECWEMQINTFSCFCQPHRMGHGQHLNLKWIWMDGWMFRKTTIQHITGTTGVPQLALPPASSKLPPHDDWCLQSPCPQVMILLRRLSLSE